MKKITSDNILEKDMYQNIMNVLNAHKKGLEFRPLAFALMGEKRFTELVQISEKKIEGIKKILVEQKDYGLTANIPKNFPRLAECLNKLIILGFVEKNAEMRKHDEREIKIYTYKPTHMHTANSTAKKDAKTIEDFHRQISNLTESKRFLLLIKNTMSVYMSEEGAGIYKKNEDVREALKKFQKKVNELMKCLDELSIASHELWKEKNYCSWVELVKLEPLFTIVINFPPPNLNNEEFLFNAEEIKKRMLEKNL